MMVTLTSPSYFSSMQVPKMTFAEGSAREVTTSDTAFTSERVRSLPPVMLYTIPVARSMDLSSKGAEAACWAASSALFLPVPVPTPSMAVPEFVITVFTSAKSTFTSPGMVMMSAIPWTPCLSTSSARRKASCKGVLSPTMSRSLSFGITIRVSTLLLISAMASTACWDLLFPSKVKGYVTTPTVRLPADFAIPATTGAAPDPVPPPMPAVMKTMSVSRTASAMASWDSSAAFSPRSLFPPVPRPLVSSCPI
mmetsp:Transcript_5472/g.16595  ORF Transcript_5472/g.16595 Transcript_5472/m.16595 type:complete len:252 (+) Transcript_5472:266-1021(+)